MKIFGKKKEKKNGNNVLIEMSLQKALEECKNYKKNLEVLQETLDNVKVICKKSKTSKVAKEILKELGE